MRKASVAALQSLYEVDDNVPSLDLFTQRFSNRMIELADDIDVSVAVCAIGLLKQLLRCIIHSLRIMYFFCLSIACADDCFVRHLGISYYWMIT